MKRRLVLLAALAAFPVALSACGETVDVPGASAGTQKGAQLFAARCSGCHTLDSAGAQGSATKVRDRERVDGPNFNQRKESVRAGPLRDPATAGSPARSCPQNIVVGEDARDVARFLAKYSGKQAKSVRQRRRRVCERPSGATPPTAPTCST